MLMPHYVSSQSNEDTMKEFLESFCRENYSDCFSGREYVRNTLTVNKIQKVDDSTVKASGKHAYRGSFGALYEEMDYIVFITIEQSRINIKFNKLAKADFFNSTDYWEKCTKSIEK